MIDKKFGKDLFLVILSNGVKLISSVLTVFMIPLIFTQQDYGFYKLFLLYISYVGIFHFGFIDGIYLHYAGKNYDELGKTSFRTYTKFLTIMQTVIAVLVIGASFFFSKDRQLILMLVGINLIVLNLTSYYQFISQITQRFNEFAIRNIIYTVLNVTLIGIFFLFEIGSYQLFLLCVTLINVVLLLWYVISYRDIIFGKKENLRAEKENIIYLFKTGIILMCSNLVVMFFSSIPRQFVDIKYPIELFPDIFSNFSFAYTLMGFTSVFLSAISLVLYPTLKRTTKDDLKNKYNDFNSIVLTLVFILIAAFFPMSYMVNWILPDYTIALKIFFVLSPGVAITSAITVIIHNYYKTLDKNKEFFIVGFLNLIILITGIFLTHTFISKDIIYIAATTTIVQFIWYLSLDIYLNKEFKKLSIKNILFIVVSSVLFYSTYFIENLFIGFFAYGLIILIIILLFYGKQIYDLYLKLKRTKSKSIK